MSTEIKGLGGYVCVRNGYELDYCWEEAVRSLLPVCEQVVISDGESTDGTWEAIQRWAERESKIKPCRYAWPYPKGESDWWLKYLDFARIHLDTAHQVYLDADEILSDARECYDALRKATNCRHSLRVDRLNFWQDAHSLIPDGHAVGKFVVRVGPAEYEPVSDEPRHPGERKIVDEAIECPGIKIYHLGFLRKKEAFYKKANVVLHAFFNRYDTRLEEGEKQGKQLWETECDFSDKLVRFNGPYPESVVRWLRERGHLV